MQPEQQQVGGLVPGPANQYDFIVNPPQNQPPPSGGLPAKLSGGGSGKKFLIFVGGGLFLVVLLLLIVLLFSGGNPDVDKAVGLTQSQQETIRISELGDETADQQLKNSAINSQLTLTTQQLQWRALLSEEGRVVSEDELKAKLNEDTDQHLDTARQSATFDSAFAQVLDTHLRSYASELNQIFTESSEPAIRELASTHFQQLELLVKQLPEQQ